MSNLFSQTINLQGELSGWAGISDAQTQNKFFGVRYVPDLFIQKTLNNTRFIDSEISLNGYYSKFIGEETDVESQLKLYRIWGRYATSRFEARLGLQKISFGSATLFRPLMWFDSIDPRDPLQITEGIYAILFRYYFHNNANLWLWGLYGNNQTKGWEIHPTKKNSPEWGGRLQHPILGGEGGLSYHYRMFQLNQTIFPPGMWGMQTGHENRAGIDGKWDIGVGIWFELAVSHQDNSLLPYRWRHLGNFGMDYTIGIGNGLNILGEHFFSEESQELFKSGDGFAFSAFSFRYPLNILDQIEGIFYYDWERENYYRFLNLRRIYDHWSFYLMLFWNPDIALGYPNQDVTSNFGGKGLQLMIVLNH